jgi:TfoX/Sxy family transcriptional regulator of competence genes
MPYNLDLEKRLDRFSVQLGNFDKKKMFGGVGYMMNGNMAFGIHQQYLVVRTSPEQAEKLLKKDTVKLFNITGRTMKGWVMVSAGEIANDRQLLDMLNAAIEHAKTLPAK